MIETTTGVFIDFDVLEEWLQKFLKDDLPGKKLFIIEQEHHCNKGSRFFASVDVDEPLTKQELLERVASEHSRGTTVYFYVDDVIIAACTVGELEGNSFNVYAD